MISYLILSHELSKKRTRGPGEFSSDPFSSGPEIPTGEVLLTILQHHSSVIYLVESMKYPKIFFIYYPIQIHFPPNTLPWSIPGGWFFATPLKIRTVSWDDSSQLNENMKNVPKHQPDPYKNHLWTMSGCPKMGIPQSSSISRWDFPLWTNHVWIPHWWNPPYIYHRNILGHKVLGLMTHD